MADLLVRDLVIATEGRLSLAAMPPRDGDLLMLRRSTAVAAEVQPGNLFWALSGPHNDGMEHIEEAFARGAAGAVISGREIEPWPGKFTVAVADVRVALWQAAMHARSRFSGAVIGVAGDGQATKVADFIHRVLGSQLSGTSATSNSCGADDAPALGLLNAHPSHDYVVLTLGDDQATRLAQDCCPHVCVLTGGNGTTGLVSMLEALPDDGWAILNGDDPVLRSSAQGLPESTRVIWFGRGSQNDLVASSSFGEHAAAVLPALTLAKILNISDLSAAAALANVPSNADHATLARVPLTSAWQLPAMLSGLASH